jgi:hypothetical protein
MIKRNTVAFCSGFLFVYKMQTVGGFERILPNFVTFAALKAYCHHYGWQWQMGPGKRVKTAFLAIFMELKV